ncbi:hypothetical protein K4K59_001914 [Colletotrichum sp. SAR11_240]|nr:hypothetical protein K4K59_001914 [Colletotrichum sp. SAR11_240]
MLPVRLAPEAEPAPSPGEDYAYSHEATVAAIKSYYEFIDRMHPNETALEYPPANGWPQITQESFASLGKTHDVIELLRHIPYFADDEIEILASTKPRSFIDPQLCEMIHEASERLRSKLALEETGNQSKIQENITEDEDGFPCSMILLAIGEEYGFKVYLDTTFGLIILTMNGGNFPNCEPKIKGDMSNPYIDWDAVEAQHQRRLEGSVDEEDDENDVGQNDWRTTKSQAFRIDSFFDMCREQWRLMNFMPMLEDPGRVAMLEHANPSEDEVVRQNILKAVGWPGLEDNVEIKWDKESAQKRMIEYFGDWGPV